MEIDRLSQIKQFKVGQIWEMIPWERSHVKKPYPVEIVEIGDDYIVTSIPKGHELKISFDNNWDYHFPRFIKTKITRQQLNDFVPEYSNN